MSGISTGQQAVDMEKFGPNHEKTFHSGKEKRPGKTTYVCREGRMVVREDGWTLPVTQSNSCRDYYRQVDFLQREATRPYQLATVADLPNEP
jgi:hypothetical protein